MTTLAELADIIAVELNRDDIGSETRDAIKAAIRRYENRPWHFNSKRLRLDATVGQEYYTLNSTNSSLKTRDGSALASGVEVIEPKDVFYDKSGERVLLRKRNSADIEGLLSDTVVYTEPVAWSWDEGELRIYPTPTAAWRFYIFATCTEGSLGSSDATNAWLDGLPGDLIKYAAKRLIAAGILEDENGARMYGVLEAEAAAAMDDRRSAALSAKRRPWGVQ